MKLVIAIVHGEDAGELVDALTAKGYRVTRLHSTGGFLKETNTTVMTGDINPMPPIIEPGEFYMALPGGAHLRRRAGRRPLRAAVGAGVPVQGSISYLFGPSHPPKRPA